MDQHDEPAVPQHHTGATFAPADIMWRFAYERCGLIVESFASKGLTPYSYQIEPASNLFVFAKHSARLEGETWIDGVPRSSRRNLSNTVCVVPAGRRMEGWTKPTIFTEVTMFCLDPETLSSFAASPLIPGLDAQLFLSSSSIDVTATKMKSLSHSKDANDRVYSESLSLVLQHELFRLASGKFDTRTFKGNLAPWRERRIKEYIEKHLTEGVTLAQLAQVADLSPSHFAHAFRASFGLAPHQYLNSLRISAAKALLVTGEMSVAEIAASLGYSSVSAFIASFRKATGVTPLTFRRV